MARSRIIKPGFFLNDDLAECGPLAHLLFAALWLLADGNGRLEDRPKRIKVQSLPHYDCDVNELLDSLQSRGFIQRYKSASLSLIQICNFREHQHIHKDEPRENWPAPVENRRKPEKTGRVRKIATPSSSSSSSYSSSPSNSYSSSPEPPTEVCTETCKSTSSEPPMLEFPTNGPKKSWNLTREKFSEYGESFPGLDVLAECRAALQWCRDNPTRRKTANGMAAFLGRWLSKANDRKARGDPVGASSQHKPGVDIDNLEF